MAKPSSRIRAASLISGCCTPTSPRAAKDRLLYYAFDLLYLDGFDLRGARLAERKRLLAELLADASERILFAEHLEGEGAQIQERAGAMGVIVETPASLPNL
jgi:ATP-dependent DNA ligase